MYILNRILAPIHLVAAVYFLWSVIGEINYSPYTDPHSIRVHIVTIITYSLVVLGFLFFSFTHWKIADKIKLSLKPRFSNAYTQVSIMMFCLLLIYLVMGLTIPSLLLFLPLFLIGVLIPVQFVLGVLVWNAIYESASIFINLVFMIYIVVFIISLWETVSALA